MTICGYKQDENTLTITIPISDALIADACELEAVARMAGELAAKTAHDAVIRRRKHHDGPRPD